LTIFYEKDQEFEKFGEKVASQVTEVLLDEKVPALKIFVHSLLLLYKKLVTP
jgi:hypothetical protein